MCDPTKSANAERQVRIRQVVNDCIDRRAAGDAVTDQSLIAAHPELMPELEAALRDLRLVEKAQMAVEQALPEGLHIRCPQCKNPIEIVDDSSLSDLVCASCGSTFQLTDDSDRTFRAGREEMVNHFQLLERVGVGAFGSVWSARDTQLDRTVALKIPRKGQMGPEDQEQFIREARAAAQLKHPSIVRVLEVGRYKDRIYIACDFIEGVDLADWLTDQQTTSREAAELCATVADALEHAHKHGVIHRDLKPSNIMLDRSGGPHLMDFGLAKREAAEMTMTLEGKLLGTPAYMSPEQARGAAHEADARSDVYSLGVVLFELLTGERPFRGSTRMLLHQVLVEDAPSPRKLNPSVPRDIETICLKCLEKDPSRRYQSAGVLRDDLRRFLDGHPVRARPITRSARTWRWTERNPAVSGLVAAIACLLLFLAIGGLAVAIRQQRLATAAKKSEVESQRHLAQQYIQRGRTACDSGFVAQGLHWFARSLDVIPAEDTALRSSTTENLRAWSRCPVTPTAVFHNKKRVAAIGYSPDNTTMVTVGHEVKLWSAQTGKLIHDLQGQNNSSFFEFSTDGRRLLTAGWGPTATLWSVETGQTLATLEHGAVESVNGVAFSRDGDFLVTAARNGLRRWSGETFELVSRTEINHSNSKTATFSSDGSLLLTNGDNGLTTIWSVESNQTIGEPMKRGDQAQFSLDGQLLVTAFEGKVRVWSTDDGRQLWQGEHFDRISTVSFDPAGEFVLTTSEDGTARVWSAEDGVPQTNPLQHGCRVVAGAFHPNGESLVTVDHLGFIRHWSTITGKLLTRSARFDPYSHTVLTRVAFRNDGERLMVSPFASEAFELDTSNLQPFAPLLRLSNPDGWSGFQVAINHKGTRAVTGGWNGRLGLWSLETGKPLGTPLDYERIWRVYHSPTGPYFIAATGYGGNTQLRVVNAAEDQLIEVCTLADAKATVTFSPEGDLVVTGSSDQTALFWSTTTWTEIEKPLSLPGKLVSASFFPEGDLAAFLCDDDIVRFWSPATGQFDGTIFRHPQASAVVVSPDGGQVATGGPDRQVIIWDFATRRASGIVLAHDSRVDQISYTPDGRRLLTATNDASVYMWDVDTGERIGPPIVQRVESARDIAFGPNRNCVLVGLGEGAELWGVGVSTAVSIEDPDVWVRAITGRKMNSSGVLEWLDRKTWLGCQQRASKH